MFKRIWYSHGKRIEGVFCAFCDVRRSGRIIQETFRWRVLLKCGHVVNRGTTLPWEELERKGYINYAHTEDPRYTAKKKQLFAGVMAKRAEVLRSKWALDTLGGGRHTL